MIGHVKDAIKHSWSLKKGLENDYFFSLFHVVKLTV